MNDEVRQAVPRWKTFTAASGHEKFDMTTKQTVENVGECGADDAHLVNSFKIFDLMSIRVISQRDFQC